MTGSRKRFANERHTSLKLAISALSLVGFAAAWAGFSSNHEPAAPLTTAPTSTSEPNAKPDPATAPARTATPRARLSRGS
jgi:hypothetical protein